MMNLQEFREFADPLIYGEGYERGSFNNEPSKYVGEASRYERFRLYAQYIKDVEPTVDINDILSNPLNKEKIYIDYYEKYTDIYFNQISRAVEPTVDINEGEIVVNYVVPRKNGYESSTIIAATIDDLFEDGWPNKYILFDEKVFNQFMNPHKNPEFLNWKSSPWGVKE